MKKLWKRIAALAAVCAMATGLAACTEGTQGGTGSTTPGGLDLTAKKDLYAFSALSTTTLLGGMPQGGGAKLALRLADAQIAESTETADGPEATEPDATQPDATEPGATEPGVTEPNATEPAGPAEPGAEDALKDQIAEVNRYLAMFEGMLSGGGPIQVTEQENAEYNGTVYQRAMTIAVTNLDGTVSERVMYYNETVKEQEPEEDEDEEKDKKDKDGKGEETEQESSISGIMLAGGQEYTVTGEREIEGDEFEVKFTAVDAAGNTVTMKQEVEADESEFKYSVKDAAGKLVESSKLEFETEDGEQEIKLELTAGGVTNVYKFEKDEDGIRIKYRGADGEVSCKVKVVENADGTKSYEYKFKDGGKVEMDRHQDDEDDDED